MVNTRAQSKKPHFCFSLEDSDHQSTDPGAIIGSNDDLLTQILLRLPVTSILRFKSVSKHWLWLLSDKHFTQRYDSLLKSPGLFVGNKYVPFDDETPNTNTPPFRSLDCYFDSPGVKILHSCNGLLLCCINRGPKDVRKYYVFNPTTKQLELIPPIPSHNKYECYMALAYHPTDCVHYKLVCVVHKAIRSFQIQIYSSNTRKWKISIKNFSASALFFHKQGVYWNGAVHWVQMYFNLDLEQFQTLPLPEEMLPSKMFMYFGESRGHLHLIAYDDCQEDSLHLNVYEMLSDYSGWFVKYQLQFDQLVVAFPEMISPYGNYFFVIDVMRSEEDEENTFVVLKTCKNFITYNVRDKSFKQISSSPKYLLECPSDFHRYTETLSSF